MFDMAAEVMPPCMTGHFPIACDISFMALPSDPDQARFHGALCWAFETLDRGKRHLLRRVMVRRHPIRRSFWPMRQHSRARLRGSCPQGATGLITKPFSRNCVRILWTAAAHFDQIDLVIEIDLRNLRSVLSIANG
jgi:hypothetical protein